ncbi:MAG: cell wall-binding repeat-containing protein [Actinobacteria bacterium]|nr:cell wall-binding repeat-containing protein [Actinomycetota bacterium]
MLVVTLVASLLVAVARPAAAASAVGRIAGPDRVATAVAVADAGWDQAPHVLMATSIDYPDAIAAAALAASHDAPVLLNPPNGLAAPVRDALARLGAERVTILGGPKAVSTTVEGQLRDLDLTVERLAGDDRFETAAAIAESTTARAHTPVAALALGTRPEGDAWPDALSAASLAGLEVPVPTLLTSQGELSDATREALEEMAPERVVVLGGEAAVSDRVADQVAALGVAVDRAEGDTRYRTAIAVARKAISGVHPDSGRLGADQAVFASGETFPDALAAGALAARRGDPLLLVPSGRLADSVDAYLRHDDTPVTAGVLIGGTSAVGEFVQQELDAAITGAPRPTPPPPPEPECPPNSSPDCAYTYRHSISTWERLARCESGGNWAINTGNGYYGGLQFSLSSWRAVGGAGYPHQASKWEQIHRGERLQSMQGWGAWPACSRKLGLR